MHTGHSSNSAMLATLATPASLVMLTTPATRANSTTCSLWPLWPLWPLQPLWLLQATLDTPATQATQATSSRHSLEIDPTADEHNVHVLTFLALSRWQQQPKQQQSRPAAWGRVTAGRGSTEVLDRCERSFLAFFQVYLMLTIQGRVIESGPEPRLCAWDVAGCRLIPPRQLSGPLTAVAATIVPDRPPNPRLQVANGIIRYVLVELPSSKSGPMHGNLSQPSLTPLNRRF